MSVTPTNLQEIIVGLKQLGYDIRVKGDGGKSRMYLDEKYFRRIEKFDGDLSKYKGWIFDFGVILSQVDVELGKAVKALFKEGLKDTDLTVDFPLGISAFRLRLKRNTIRNCMGFWSH